MNPTIYEHKPDSVQDAAVQKLTGKKLYASVHLPGEVWDAPVFVCPTCKTVVHPMEDTHDKQ
jgi:hypothetical protein